MAFYQQLGVEPGITAVIGSGGKTSLLGRLAEEVPGTVILCTTTHIRPFPAYPLLTEPTPEIVRQALANSRVLCLGTPCENNKLTAPALPLDVLAGLADYVLVEADGSRQLPLKAHGPQEPVIPGPSAWQAPPASAGPSGRRSTGRSGSAPSPARRKRPQPRRNWPPGLCWRSICAIPYS